MLVDYGMQPIDALKTATSINADAFHINNEVGRLKKGLIADLLIVEGNPAQTISDIRNVKKVYKNGILVELK
jgi:imidazolonepropionase-like amidohydrolase